MTSYQSYRDRAIEGLLWLSPWVGWGFAFPLGVLFAIPRSSKVRKLAFFLTLHLASSGLLFLTIHYIELFEQDSLYWIASFLLTEEGTASHFPFIAIGIIYTLSNILFHYRQKNKVHYFFPIVYFVSFQFLFGFLHPEEGLGFHGIEALWIWYGISFYILNRSIGKRKEPILWRSLYFLMERYYKRSPSQKKKLIYSVDSILPGSGWILIGNFWLGFTILFISLLILLYLATFLASYENPGRGIQFLYLLQLKPGINDKKFFEYMLNPYFLYTAIAFWILIWSYSKYLIYLSFKEEKDNKGILPGFLYNLPYSILLYLLFISIILVLPFSIQRKKDSDSKSQYARHFQPENLEFYFIDPNIPDKTEGLNGGVLTGNADKEEDPKSEKIPDPKISDNGPKTGYVKKIKGKKLPPTYSNYISAKIRGPEEFFSYWKKAPPFYSTVVAYTITSEGEITDIELVEASRFPEQDRLTLELIEAMGSLLPPPQAKGDVRVTELFWNGPVDPDRMPTPLQKALVQQFDGRYMEEQE